MTIHTRILYYVIAVAVVLYCDSTVRSQGSSSQSINEGASISAPLRLIKVTDLNFGTIIQGPNPGNVVLSERGARTFPSDPLGPAEFHGASASINTTSTAASFLVTGEPLANYSISTPETSVLHNGPYSMTVTLSKPVGASIGGDGTAGKLSADGIDNFTIGATLSVGPNQPSGTYSGTFTEIIAYQ